MTRNLSSIPALIAIGLCLGNASTSSAQHPHGVAKHRPKVVISLFTPQGRPVTQHQDHYRYVVPPAPRHGAYYTYENTYYYTPPAPQGAGQPPRPMPMKCGGSVHIEELAERIEFLANELCLDLHHNYRHNPGFRETYGQAYEFLQAAKFIHNREHQGDREAIRRTVTRIDDLFHHMQADVIRMERREIRPIGQLALEAKVEELQALIHHLMYDQGIKPDHDRDQHGPARPVGPGAREEAPPPQ